VLDRSTEDGIVEVGSSFDCLGPGAIVACFIDDGVNNFLLDREGAIPVPLSNQYIVLIS
jgi:hypothetical protein